MNKINYAVEQQDKLTRAEKTTGMYDHYMKLLLWSPLSFLYM